METETEDVTWSRHCLVPHLASFSLHHIWPRGGSSSCSLTPGLWTPSVAPRPLATGSSVSSAAGRCSRCPRKKRVLPGHCRCVIRKQPALGTLTVFAAYNINHYPAPTSTTQGGSQLEATEPNSSPLLRPCPVTLWVEETRISWFFILCLCTSVWKLSRIISTLLTVVPQCSTVAYHIVGAQ